MKLFDIDNLPQQGKFNFYTAEDAHTPSTPVRAARINGPFVVKTESEELKCDNGYLVIDLDGFPYPIEHGLFNRMYRRLGVC